VWDTLQEHFNHNDSLIWAHHTGMWMQSLTYSWAFQICQSGSNTSLSLSSVCMTIRSLSLPHPRSPHSPLNPACRESLLKLSATLMCNSFNLHTLAQNTQMLLHPPIPPPPASTLLQACTSTSITRKVSSVLMLAVTKGIMISPIVTGGAAAWKAKHLGRRRRGSLRN
jgi:hypothetical protein